MANSYEILLAIGGKLSSSLTTSISGASKSLQGIESAAAKSSKSLGSINGVAATASKGLGSLKGVVVGLVGALWVTVGFGAMIDAASKAEDTTSQLQAVLKSTGGVAGVTQEAAEKLASSLGNVTTFGRNAVLDSENLLLTFTQIGKNVMPQATEAVLDMATSLKEDTKSAAMQLGKALNDPVAGVTALQRVGVKLTAQQKDQVKAMVAVGNVAGAQAVILKELGTEFGGSAKAAGQTFSGQMDIAKNAVTGAMAQIGTALIPTIQSVLPKLTDGIRNFSNFVTDHQGDIKNAVSSIGPVFSYIGDTIIPGVQKAIEDLTPTFIKAGVIVKNDVFPVIKDGFNTAIGVAKEFKDNLNLVIPVVSGLATVVALYKVQQMLSNKETVAAMAITALSKAWGVAATLIGLLREGESLAAVAQLALNLAMEANPISLVVIAIGLLVAAGVALYMNFGTVKQVLSDTWVSIKNSSIEGVNGCISLIDDFIGVLNKIPGVNIPILSKIGLDVSGNSTAVGMKAARMATGGIVQHRSGGIMANIGEGSYDEAVVPLKKSGGLMANIGGGARTSSNATAIHYNPIYQISGSTAPEVQESVKQAAVMSQSDFARFMKQYEMDKQRVSFAQ